MATHVYGGTPPPPAWNPPVESGATPAAMAAALQQYGSRSVGLGGSAPYTGPNPNTVNQSTYMNPYTVQQFQQMYAQNPMLAARMYEADPATQVQLYQSMGWTEPQAQQFAAKGSFIAGNANPNAGLHSAFGAYSLAPGSNVNEGAFQKLMATGHSNTYANPAAVPGLTTYGSQFNPQAGSYLGGGASPYTGQSFNGTSMSNLNSKVGTQPSGSNGSPYGTGYTGFGNSVMAGPSPTGPTNLPTGPGVNPNTASTSGTNNTHVAGGTGPSTPLVPNGGTPGIAPAPAAPVGPDGGGTPYIGPAPNVSPTPTSGNTGGGYAGTNISNSNYNNRFGMNLV